MIKTNYLYTNYLLPVLYPSSSIFLTLCENRQLGINIKFTLSEFNVEHFFRAITIMGSRSKVRNEQTRRTSALYIEIMVRVLTSNLYFKYHTGTPTFLDLHAFKLTSVLTTKAQNHRMVSPI